MMRDLSRWRVRVVGLCVLTMVGLCLAAPAEAAVLPVPCDSVSGSPPAHCYAVRTQGFTSAGNTLNGVDSVTSWVQFNCMSPMDSRTSFVNSEFWLGTTPTPGSPAFGSPGHQPEWVETGLTTGVFQGYGSVSKRFFWARNYWTGSQYHYDEFLISGSPVANTNYILSITWVSGSGSGTGWRIRQGAADKGGGSANQPPGTQMYVQAGTEAVTSQDGISGSVSHLSRSYGSTTISGLTGDLYLSPSFNYSTTGAENLTFRSASAHDGACSTN
jgi:hypothetical protein